MKKLNAGDQVWYMGCVGPSRWCRVEDHCVNSHIVLAPDEYFGKTAWNMSERPVSLTKNKIDRVTYK